ncbi:hypothetical protein RND81_11G144600 [Saponaria officinalis]|uniref:non-specific serine/threonine protein kinase n=1 Tax=Saponaria officinalis TaxID=3572 RepID=A0AAW1HM14_SAPOF
MAMLSRVFSLLILILHIHLFSGKAKTLTVTNNCTYTVWPGISGTNQKNDSGFVLLKGESRVIAVQKNWKGRVWGRTLCSIDKSNGNFSCVTGDCATNNIECAGESLTFPVTLAEFAFSIIIENNEDDFYDVSVAQGYNVPLMVAPNVETGAGCDVTGCVFDLKKSCVAELAVLSDPTNSSSIIGCRGLCDVDTNCCNSTTSCPGDNSSFSTLIYKKPCPRAYSFPLDDVGDTFTCDGSKVSTYNITFCPSPNMSRLLSMPSSQAAQPAVAVAPTPTPIPTTAPTPIPTTSPSTVMSPVPLIQPTNSTTKPISHNSPSNTSKRKLRTSLTVAFPTAAVLLILLVIFVCICRWKTMKENNGDIRRSVDSLQFDFNTIRSATRNFAADNKLGGGGFGDVYKGKLEDGQEIAVKRLSKNSVQGIAEFETEIILVAKLNHKNLVKLLGYCVAPQESLLVYEFLPNSSLDKFLFDPTRKSSLDWPMRLKIITGIARGLMYLHEDSRLKIVHRDLKTSNILLDEAMNPKIADFGLARLFEVDQTQGNTRRIAGTYGYMAPEYAKTGHYSTKSDVYSFGVIVLEIVSGQRTQFFRQVQLDEALLHRAWRLWNENKAINLIDTELGDNFKREEVLKCIQIGLLCIQENAIDRPRMTTIVAALYRQDISLPAPKPPNFFGCVVDGEARDRVDEYGNPYIHTGAVTVSDLYSRE